MNMMPADATPTPICSSLISKLYRFAPMSLHRRRTATSSSLHTRPPNPSFSHRLQSIRLPNFRSQKRSLVIKASASPPPITDNVCIFLFLSVVCTYSFYGFLFLKKRNYGIFGLFVDWFGGLLMYS